LNFADSSKTINKALKCFLTLFLIVIVSLLEFGCINAVVKGLGGANQLLAMLMDNVSLTFPFLFFGLYSNLSFQAVETFASIPFILMIFFSTTFSPGSGLEGVKDLRYLFSRFYWFCILPGVQDSMEGCPSDEVVMVYMVLSAMLGLVVFLLYQSLKKIHRTVDSKNNSWKRNALKDNGFRDLQVELYGVEMVDQTDFSNSSARS
jgi:hypothetical protein